MTTSDIDTIIDFIRDVDAHDHDGIERIRLAVLSHPAAFAPTRTPARRRGMGCTNEAGHNVGDTVQFVRGQISPAYLGGLTAVVQNTNAKSVVVDLPAAPEYGRFSGKSNVRVPNSTIKGV